MISVSDSQMRCPPGVQLDIVTQRPCDIRFGMSAMKRTWSPYPILRQRVRSASHFNRRVRVSAGGRPSGVVTFLFTDIEGSTRRWEADADAMRAALSKHDQVLKTAI